MTYFGCKRKSELRGIALKRIEEYSFRFDDVIPKSNNRLTAV